MRTRFVPSELVSLLLDCWARTAVGHKVMDEDMGSLPHGDAFSRYARMVRASRMFARTHGIKAAISETAAYKDLDALLGQGPGQILVSGS